MDKTSTFHDDEATKSYFDNNTPNFNPSRFEFALDYLKDVADPSQNLIDIGCGNGSTMALIKKSTTITNFTGLDISKSYLEIAHGAVGCQRIEGSILDGTLVSQHKGEFDYCTLGAVLHHLIGKSRRESHEFAVTCLRNAFQLLKPGGTLIVFEPAHSPRFLMDVVFWIKKLVGFFVASRVEVLTKAANLGQPIVSYYTPDQLREMVGHLKYADCREILIDQSRSFLFLRRVGTGYLIKR